MEYTKPALLLMKKYAAKCNVNWNNLKATVFQSHLESRAEVLGFKKIPISVVRWYWLKVHNSIISKLLESKRVNEKEAKYCMVSIKNGNVYHKGILIEKIKGSQ